MHRLSITLLQPLVLLLTTLLLPLANGSEVFAAKAVAVAKILERQGDVSVLGEDGKRRPARVYGTVYLGDRIKVEKKAHVVLGFKKNRNREKVKGENEVTVTREGCNSKQAVEKLSSPKTAKPIISKLVSTINYETKGGITIVRSGVMTVPPRVHPANESVTWQSQPTFQWPKVADAVRYEVIVRSSGSTRKRWSGTTNKTSLTYAGRRKLSQDSTYEWQVFVTLKDGTVKPLRSGGFDRFQFTTATAETAEVVADLKKLKKSNEMSILALTALWYDERSFFQEAIVEFEYLVKLAPRSAPFHARLAALYQKTGRRPDSERERMQAEQLGFEFEEVEADK